MGYTESLSTGWFVTSFEFTARSTSEQWRYTVHDIEMCFCYFGRRRKMRARVYRKISLEKKPTEGRFKKCPFLQ